MTPQIAVSTLLKQGMTEAEIARRVGISQPTVNRIKHGKPCWYETGKCIIDLAEAGNHQQARAA